MADKIKKLSDAIRLGSTMSKQCVGELFFESNVTKESYSCALGAAYQATFGERGVSHSIAISGLKERYGIKSILIDDIMSWNDSERLSFEQIADRLEARGL